MNVDFLDPVSDRLLAHNLMLPDQIIGRNLRIHTQQDGFPDLKDVRVVFLTIDDLAQEEESLHFRFRKQFYSLFSGNWDFSIADLGQLTSGESPEDTYFVIQSIVAEMYQRNILTVLVGGSQDNSLGMFRGLSKMNTLVNITSVDARFDFGSAGELVSDDSYMSKIITEKPNNLKQFTNLGYQSYYVSQEELDLMQKLFFDAYRLGEVSSEDFDVEPIIRDTDIFSVDLTAVKASELNSAKGLPNGFSGAQICSLMRYAGLSDRLNTMGLFNIPNTFMTDQLLAQMVWYVLEGYCHRVNEYPFSVHESCTKYAVPLDEDTLIFYKSHKSHRWWIEVPKEGIYNNNREKTLLPCAETDYREAQKGELPARWWKSVQRSMH